MSVDRDALVEDRHRVAKSAADFVQRQWPVRPRAGIILGTGLGNLASHIGAAVRIPYRQIPGFPCSTAIGHRGQLVCGTLAGAEVVAMEGRFHFYEGYSADQVTMPVRMMRQLGADILIVSNASGGLNPQFRCGDVVVMTGHINFMGSRTAQLVGDRFLRGDRSVANDVAKYDNTVTKHDEWKLLLSAATRSDEASPYDGGLIESALATSRRHNFACHRGVYLGVLGPNYETRAEYRMMRRLGADVVGMSTVPELLVAAQCGMRVLALSMVANVAKPDAPTHVDAQEVIDVVSTTEPHLRQIVLDVLGSRGVGKGSVI